MAETIAHLLGILFLYLFCVKMTKYSISPKNFVFKCIEYAQCPFDAFVFTLWKIMPTYQKDVFDCIPVFSFQKVLKLNSIDKLQMNTHTRISYPIMIIVGRNTAKYETLMAVSLGLNGITQDVQRRKQKLNRKTRRKALGFKFENVFGMIEMIPILHLKRPQEISTPAHLCHFSLNT